MVLTNSHNIFKYDTLYVVIGRARSEGLHQFRRVKDHRNSLHYSSLLEKTCVGQVALDKRSPRNIQR